MDVQTAVAVVVPAVLVIAWAVRVESRVKAHEEFKAEVREDIRYIRGRLDRVLNGRHGE